MRRSTMCLLRYVAFSATYGEPALGVPLNAPGAARDVSPGVTWAPSSSRIPMHEEVLF